MLIAPSTVRVLPQKREDSISGSGQCGEDNAVTHVEGEQGTSASTNAAPESRRANCGEGEVSTHVMLYMRKWSPYASSVCCD